MSRPGISKDLVDRIGSLSDGSRAAKSIALELGVSAETVRKYQIKNNFPRSTRSGMRRGPGHPGWRSGRKLDRDGYVLISCGPEHPHIRRQRGRRVGVILEHRIMAEIKLGRLLDPMEVVDHIDGVKIHNHPDNLRVFAGNSDHLRATISGQVPQWSPLGKAKIFENLVNQKRGREFPDKIDIHRQNKEQGVLRLRQIHLAHESLDSQSIWFLGMRRYFEKAGIDWPLDQKTEEDLQGRYLQMILRHPMLKLWIEG